MIAELAQRSLGSGGPLGERPRPLPSRRRARGMGRAGAGAARSSKAISRRCCPSSARTGRCRAHSTASGRGRVRWRSCGRSTASRRSFAPPATGCCRAPSRCCCGEPARGRSPASRGRPADLPLLDEARAYLAGPPRRYGHVVVDEAQDLSPMALRMVARRSIDGRSFTDPRRPRPGDDSGCARRLGRLTGSARTPGRRPDRGAVGRLPRSPGEIMAVANRVLAATSPGLRPTTSVRSSGREPAFLPAPAGDIGMLGRVGRERRSSTSTTRWP